MVNNNASRKRLSKNLSAVNGITDGEFNSDIEQCITVNSDDRVKKTN